MSSHDLKKAYDSFYRRIKEEGGNADNAVVCNTGGNRLMGTAALLAANDHNLIVVYRDINAKPDVLTALKLGDHNRYQSGDVRINRCPICDEIDWDWLYGKENPAVESADDLIKNVLLSK